jgi:hypothetical protein
MSSLKPAKSFVSRSSSFHRTKSQWLRDLTSEGVEPNPGPKPSKSRSKSRPKKKKGSRGKKRADGDIPRPIHCTVTTASCSVPKIPRNYLFRFLDSTQTLLSGSNVGTTAGSYYFSLNANVQSGTLVSLFDQYRFLACRFRFLPRQNLIAPSASTYPPLYTVIDYDNATAPASRGAIQSYSNCSESQVYESVERTFCPHIATAAYSGSFTSYSNMAKVWIDSASPSVQHYGIKYWIDTCPIPIPVWDIVVEYWIQFRNTI